MAETDAPRIQTAQGKPVFVVDWDSNSIESYEEEASDTLSIQSQQMSSFSASFHKEGMDPELQ